ncbi:MAG: Holliday junction resolvase RuvX [Candidatus Paceibacterota bacterium]
MKFLGVDYGTKRIGLAVADSDTSIATPLKTINNDDTSVAAVINICKDRSIDTIILGESKTHRGVDNPVMVGIRSFKKSLEEKTEIPVVYVPEFFSSAQARRQPEAGQHVDGSAAAIILQSFLDSKPHEKDQ